MKKQVTHTSSESTTIHIKSADRRDRVARSHVQEFSPGDEVVLEERTVKTAVSRGVLEKQVRDCDPVTLVVFTEESYSMVKTELREELEESISWERKEQIDE